LSQNDARIGMFHRAYAYSPSLLSAWQTPQCRQRQRAFAVDADDQMRVPVRMANSLYRVP